MDRLESLSNTLSQITLYDIKSMYNQAKNVVLNISETEAKVREATNDEAWGASSTLMQEIAQGTFNFQQFNEIMPCIYGRFMEKEARQWRQIYKALQLLEYLVKHGSERVVDDARSHISTLKMLRNFHYIDEKGKDEGINVRNRAKELVELLSDVEKIRTERRKAKTNKSKYIGVGNEDMSFGGGGSRYGGFGNDTLGGSSSYSNDTADYYGGGSSSRMGGFSDSSSRRQYEEYNAGDDEVASGSSQPTANRSSSLRAPARKGSVPTPAPAPAPAPAPVVDLVDFGDDTTTAPPPAGLATNKALPAVSKPVGLDDDDFDDFQAAPVQNTNMASRAAPSSIPAVMGAPAQGTKSNPMQLLNMTPAAPVPGFSQLQPQQQRQQYPNVSAGLGSMGSVAAGHRPSPSLDNMSPISMQANRQQALFGGATMRPTPTSPSTFGGPMVPVRTNTASPVASATGGAQKKAASSNFDDLWNLSLASSSGGKGSAGAGGTAGQGKSIKDLEKEKAMAGLWGNNSVQKPPSTGSLGNFGGFGTGGSTSSGGDDLLL